MKQIVVLPTYNEKDNLSKVVQQIFLALPQGIVLIVDDNSPDGTGELAETLKAELPEKIEVLHRTHKEGLGKAYLDGFQKALDLGAEQIFQMDADLSHPPALLTKMSEALKQTDFVLGSRYTAGGGIEKWSFFRKLVSRFGNLYAQLILSSPIKDLTGGFKAFNRKILEYLLSTPIECTGYGFQIEMTSRAVVAGFSYQEIPFIFTEREQGVSKMSQEIFWEAFIKIFQLRSKIKTTHS